MRGGERSGEISVPSEAGGGGKRGGKKRRVKQRKEAREKRKERERKAPLTGTGFFRHCLKSSTVSVRPIDSIRKPSE
jgi:hypothetical protein